MIRAQNEIEELPCFLSTLELAHAMVMCITETAKRLSARAYYDRASKIIISITRDHNPIVPIKI